MLPHVGQHVSNPCVSTDSHEAQDVMTDVRSMTYDEIAETWGIARESARQLVIRKRWKKTKGNDNKARVEVPIEALDSVGPSDDTSDATSQNTADTPSDDTADSPPFLATMNVLTRHIERLEDELASTKAAFANAVSERDIERARAAQVEALQAVLDVERSRLIAAEQDRDRWHAEAEQDRAVRRADAEQARTEAEMLRTELMQWKARPWWRRAFG